jgi:AcrR family transcriptional regulator
VRERQFQASRLPLSLDTEIPSSPFRSSQQRREERFLKRQAVLQAAVRMFNERGFHATSLDDVAASLSVTKPVIYHYLGNKDQVLFECVRFGLSQIREAAVAARAEAGTGLDRLKAFLRRYAEINMDDFGRCVIRTGDETLSPESRREFRALKREIDQEMREVITEGVADGSIHAPDVRLTAFTLAGALNWPARWFEPEGRDDRREVAAAMVEILCEGLRRRA